MKENSMEITSDTIDALNDVASEILESAIDEPTLLDEERPLTRGGNYASHKHFQQASNWASINAARADLEGPVPWDGLLVEALFRALSSGEREDLIRVGGMVLSAAADLTREVVEVEVVEEEDADA